MRIIYDMYNNMYIHTYTHHTYKHCKKDCKKFNMMGKLFLIMFEDEF